MYKYIYAYIIYSKTRDCNTKSFWSIDIIIAVVFLLYFSNKGISSILNYKASTFVNGWQMERVLKEADLPVYDTVMAFAWKNLMYNQCQFKDLNPGLPKSKTRVPTSRL
jgi:membrane-bound acyltransferase YfiQ involved in biofilm formation